MSYLFSRVLTFLGFSLCSIFLVFFFAIPGSGADSKTKTSCDHTASLTDYDRTAFVNAVYGAEENVWVGLLATPSCVASVRASVAAMNGKVHYADDKIGYLLFSLSKQRVFDVADIRGVDYATITRTYKSGDFIPLADRKLSSIPPFTLPFPQVAKELPEDGPYFPAKEAGLTDLWAKYPEADGRGVRIALVDEGIDLLHPEFLKARDASGALVPKVTALDTVTWPEVDDSWVQFGPPIRALNGVLSAANRDWRVPTTNGQYRFGVYNHKVSLGYLGDPKVHPLSMIELSAGVVWDEEKGLIWVDTDGDGDLSNEHALRDYSADQQIAWFGKLDPTGDNRIPFGVKIDRERKAASIGIARGFHGTWIAGPMTGNRLTGGLFNGAAPAAQLTDVKNAFTAIVPIVQALARGDTDVVNSSAGIARPDRPAEEFDRHLLERAFAVYRKPLVCYCGPLNAIHTGSYQSPEMLRRNRQAPPPYTDAINSSVWFSENGLVNTVNVPSTSLTAESRYIPYDVTWEDGKRHINLDTLSAPAPDGYSIGANASPTIALMSGILADLISQARQDHVRYDHRRLANAVFTSAQQIHGFPSSLQGYGRVNAAHAWEQLVKMAKADDPKNPELTYFTLAREQRGKQVHGFHADLAQPGKLLQDELWLTRVGGYASSRRYRLSLRADDGTYKLLDPEVSFVRDASMRVRFEAKITPGLHVAFIQLRDATADVVMQEVPLSVRAPEIPEVVATGIERYRQTIQPRHLEYHYFHLDEGIQAARVHVDIPWVGNNTWSSIRQVTLGPDGGTVRFTPEAKGLGEDAVAASHNVGPVEHFAQLLGNVRRGTGEIIWENRGRAEYETPHDSPAPDIPITGTLTLIKYTVELTSEGNKLQITNKLADIDGRVELHEAKLNSARHMSEGKRAATEITRTLPERLSQWRVAVSAPTLSDRAADAYLLNCTRTQHSCLVAAQGSLGESGTTLIVDDPKQGEWRIVVRARDSSQQQIEYLVREALVTPSATVIQSADAKIPSGSTISLSLPLKGVERDDIVRYAAYRIADSKKSLRVAMTPLDAKAP